MSFFKVNIFIRAQCKMAAILLWASMEFYYIEKVTFHKKIITCLRARCRTAISLPKPPGYEVVFY